METRHTRNIKHQSQEDCRTTQKLTELKII